MATWPTARGRPDARQPLPAGSRLSWATIALNGEPWPGEPPRYDPSAEPAERETATEHTDKPEAPLG